MTVSPLGHKRTHSQNVEHSSVEQWQTIILLVAGTYKVHVRNLFKRLLYCSEMYKCLHKFPIKTVPDTSLHETSDLIYAIKVYYAETFYI
jgi:hypothetical protein